MSPSIESLGHAARRSKPTGWIIGIFGAFALVAAVIITALNPASPLHQWMLAESGNGVGAEKLDESEATTDNQDESGELGGGKFVSQADSGSQGSASDSVPSLEQRSDLERDSSERPQNSSVITQGSSMSLQQLVESNQQRIQELFEADRISNQSLLDALNKIDEISQQIGLLKTTISEIGESDRRQSERLSRLGQADARLAVVAEQFERFVESELPELRSALETRMETQAVTASDSSQKSKTPQEDLGSLVIDNSSNRTVEIQINGESHQLQPGRNSYSVPIGDVEVRGEGHSWLLDAGLWQTYEGRKVLYRDKWPL